MAPGQCRWRRLVGQGPGIGGTLAALALAAAACGGGTALHTSPSSGPGPRLTEAGGTVTTPGTRTALGTRTTQGPSGTSTTTIGPLRTATGAKTSVSSPAGSVGAGPSTGVGSSATTTRGVTTTTAPRAVTTTVGPQAPTGPPVSTCLRRNFVYLSAHPATLPADGVSVSTIEASYNELCHDARNTTLSFALRGTCGSISSGQATTGTDGVARVSYTASRTAGQCVVTASVDQLSDQATIVQH